MSSFNKQVTVPYTAEQMYDLGNDINTYSKLIPLCIPLLAALSLYGESTADQQLAEFRNNPEHRGLSCRNGWWRYSRHPNYFFEWLHWFAYPLIDSLLHFQKDLQLEYLWDLSGSHYQNTAESWLDNMDQYSHEIRAVFNNTYGKKQARIWQQRWRIFFMACAELFGYSNGNGNEWQGAHYLFIKPR